MGKSIVRIRRTACHLGVGCALTLALHGAAAAQSASSSMSSFSKGYGTNASSLESPVDVATRDSSGNLTIVNGVAQAPSGSIFSNLTSLGVSSSSSGAGSTSSSSGSSYGSATAIGNNLSVEVSGSNNTVIVNSTQTNTGAISATTVLNGKVNLDGGA
jgi:holdfast attachment protein HfaA